MQQLLKKCRKICSRQQWSRVRDGQPLVTDKVQGRRRATLGQKLKWPVRFSKGGKKQYHTSNLLLTATLLGEFVKNGAISMGVETYTPESMGSSMNIIVLQIKLFWHTRRKGMCLLTAEAVRYITPLKRENERIQVERSHYPRKIWRSDLGIEDSRSWKRWRKELRSSKQLATAVLDVVYAEKKILHKAKNFGGNRKSHNKK